MKDQWTKLDEAIPRYISEKTIVVDFINLRQTKSIPSFFLEIVLNLIFLDVWLLTFSGQQWLFIRLTLRIGINITGDIWWDVKCPISENNYIAILLPVLRSYLSNCDKKKSKQRTTNEISIHTSATVNKFDEVEISTEVCA